MNVAQPIEWTGKGVVILDQRRLPGEVIRHTYTDYRDVGGIKFPFELTFLWLDGRYTAKLTDIKVNVPIDAAKFNKP